MRIWHYFFGQDAIFAKGKIVGALAQAGINTYALDPDAPRGPGVLFFDGIGQRLYNFLQEVSRNGCERVLAIAISDTVLTEDGAWCLLQAGASDVLTWGNTVNSAAQVAARFKRWHVVDDLVESPLVRNNLVGQSPAWTAMLRQIIEAARFTDASILIIGESGTGKELVARLAHTLDSQRPQQDLVVLDCTTVVPDLSGSEFFGHERGAFTGAMTQRDGAFALADGGTLFLDEVGELPLELQSQLLRVVQERTYKRVGGNTWHHTHFRLVCATNKDLHQEVARGKFRHDLYYRIASIVCKLPPLRERREDILPLVQHFMHQLRPNEETPGLDKAVQAYLLKREYPGNVRDLQQLVTRISYRHVGPGPITVGDIPEEERPSVEFCRGDWRDITFEHAIRYALALGIKLKEIGRAAEDMAERIALHMEDGNLHRAAYRLGITDRALQLRRAARRQREQAQHNDLLH